MKEFESQIKRIKKHHQYFDCDDYIRIKKFNLIDFLKINSLKGYFLSYFLFFIPTYSFFIYSAPADRNNVILIFLANFLMFAFYQIFISIALFECLKKWDNSYFNGRIFTSYKIYLLMFTEAGDITYMNKRYYLDDKKISDKELLADIKKISESHFKKVIAKAIDEIEKREQLWKKLEEQEKTEDNEKSRAKKEEINRKKETIKKLVKDSERKVIEEIIKESSDPILLFNAVKEIEKQKERLLNTKG